eukprot:gene25816-biopygen8932
MYANVALTRIVLWRPLYIFDEAMELQQQEGSPVHAALTQVHDGYEHFLITFDFVPPQRDTVKCSQEMLILDKRSQYLRLTATGTMRPWCTFWEEVKNVHPKFIVSSQAESGESIINFDPILIVLCPFIRTTEGCFLEAKEVLHGHLRVGEAPMREGDQFDFQSPIALLVTTGRFLEVYCKKATRTSFVTPYADPSILPLTFMNFTVKVNVNDCR